MSAAARSILVYSIYLFGLAEATEVWVRILLFTPLDVLFAAWTWLALRSSPQTAPISAV